MSELNKDPGKPGSPERSGNERSEFPRSAGEPGHASRHAGSNEVEARPRRRTYPNEYRLRIVREADRCKQTGEIGALLRREGLYSSQLVAWRRLRDRGALTAAASRRRPRPTPDNPLRTENEQLPYRYLRRLDPGNR